MSANRHNVPAHSENNSTGVLGVVYRDTHRKPYIVQFKGQGVRPFSKSFFTIEEAETAYRQVKSTYINTHHPDLCVGQ